MKTLCGAVAFTALLSLSGLAAAQEAAPADAAAAPAAPAEAPAQAPADAAPAAAEPVAAPQAPAPAPAAPAVAAARSALVDAPPEGKGQVVFFRGKQFLGAAIAFKVREGETELGRLSYGTYFVAPLEPGVHTFKVHSETKDELTLEVEAGETYYVATNMTMGVALHRPNMSPSDQAAFDAIGAKLKVTQLETKTAAN